MSSIKHVFELALVAGSFGLLTCPAAAQTGNCANGQTQSSTSTTSSGTSTTVTAQLQVAIRQQIAQLQAALLQLQSSSGSNTNSIQLQVQIQQQITQLQSALQQLQLSQSATQGQASALQRASQANTGRGGFARGRR